MISVVMPVYNQARFIMRAVESVWAQNLPDTEIIIVDDGSSDETPAVLRELSEKPGVRCIRQENAGPAAARNRAIRESRHEWIAFLDADDYWLDGKLKTQLQALSGGGDFAYCGTLVVDDSGKIISKHFALPHDGRVGSLVWSNHIATPAVIVRRSLLETTGFFDETLRVGEDWGLWLQLAVHGRGICVPEPLVAVRFSEWRERDYVLASYELAIPKIFARFFDSLKGRAEMASIDRQRGEIYSCHFAMLAKSHIRFGNINSFLGYAMRSVASSPWGVRYLLPARGKTPLEIREGRRRSVFESG